MYCLNHVEMFENRGVNVMTSDCYRIVLVVSDYNSQIGVCASYTNWLFLPPNTYLSHVIRDVEVPHLSGFSLFESIRLI